MVVPTNRRPTEGRTPPWRTEALLAAGFIAGSLTTRLRNPRLNLLLAAGALAWRALSPRPLRLPAPSPVLALPEAPTCVAEAAPEIVEEPRSEIVEHLVTPDERFIPNADVATMLAAVPPVVPPPPVTEPLRVGEMLRSLFAPEPPPIQPAAEAEVEPVHEAEETSFPDSPGIEDALHAEPEEEAESAALTPPEPPPIQPAAELLPVMVEPLSMMLPPAPQALEASVPDVLGIDDALHAEPRGEAGGSAWILGLEPLPVVEELPALPLAGPSPAVPAVAEHWPMIAEGAPLPDMIEIAIEPSAAGISLIQSFGDAQPASIINEGPVEAAPAAPEPVVVHVEAEAESELAVIAQWMGEPEVVAEPAAAVVVEETAASAPPPVEPLPVEEEVTDSDENELPMTLRPMPRVIQWNRAQELAVRPRNLQPSPPAEPAPEQAPAEAAQPAPAAAVMDHGRKTVPRAPASTVPSDDAQKSWLNWWK